MNIQPENTDHPSLITSCQDNAIVMNGTLYQGNLILLPDIKPKPWHTKSFEQLTMDDLIALKKYTPDIVLLGTGLQTKQLPNHWIFSLLHHGLIIECMNNRVACGTYNWMLTEERRVLLAIIMEKINA